MNSIKFLETILPIMKEHGVDAAIRHAARLGYVETKPDRLRDFRNLLVDALPAYAHPMDDAEREELRLERRWQWRNSQRRRRRRLKQMHNA